MKNIATFFLSDPAVSCTTSSLEFGWTLGVVVAVLMQLSQKRQFEQEHMSLPETKKGRREEDVGE